MNMYERFTRQYLETALWSSVDHDDEPLNASYDIDDIAEPARLTMLEDCKDFFEAHYEDIADDVEQAGHDFWLTRNRHGAGFWDADWPEKVGQKLTEASHVYGSVDLYVGDDGKIYC